MDSLQTQVQQCRLCEKELPCGPRPVIQLSRTAKILIAGQAPGRRVHETGIPFNDPSGDRLRDWMGINREVFYDPEQIAILPMAFCYPGTGKSGDLPPPPRCAETWREKLISTIDDLKLILVIGQYAHKWHLGNRQKRNLTETVRAWQEFPEDILPLPHPSPRNNIWLKKNQWFEAELLPVLKDRVRNSLTI